MIYPHEIVRFKTALDQYYERVELNRIRLEAYASKENANEQYIDRVNKDLRAQFEFANELEMFISRLSAELQQVDALKGQLKAVEYKYNQLQILAQGKGVDVSLARWVNVKNDQKWV